MEPLEDTSVDDGTPTPATFRRRWPLGALTLIVVAAIVGGLLLFGDNAGSESSAELAGALGLPTQNGEAAPDFSLTLLDGTDFRLTDHLTNDGRPVILNLWASWCGPCRAEMPAFDVASKLHTDVFFLGVAVEDDPIAAEEFAAEIGVTYALAIDEADRVGRRYPSPGLPATYFISTDGLIVRTVFGQIDEDQIDQLIAESFSR
jgi:thiol-disulfide isomerase/thioredoxin